MPVSKHLLLNVQGDYTTTALANEIWQFGIRLAMVFGTAEDVDALPSSWDPTATTINRTETDWNITGNWRVIETATTFNPDDYLNDQCADAIINFMASANIASAARVRRLTLSPVGSPDGALVPAVPYAYGTPVTLEWTGSYPTGGDGSVQLPLQDSVAVSWRTPQVGRRGKGRIFLPTTSSASLSSARLDATSQGEIRDAGVTLLESLSYTQDAPTELQIRPIVTGLPYTEYGIITQVAVGNVIDTQRRRRNRLVESYEVGSPTYT
jgi:hypothetical protein